MKLQVFDPPMCCSTGVCGPSVDPELVRFAADLDWVQRQGVPVERFNLTQQPAAFAGTQVVREALAQNPECLPLTLVDGAVACSGKYPTREMLAGYARIELRATVVTATVRELVAIGAAIACNCEPCFKAHYNEARKLGLSKEDIRAAVDVAQSVKDSPARSITELAKKYTREVEAAPAAGCCSSPADATTPCCCAPSTAEEPAAGAKPSGRSCC